MYEMELTVPARLAGRSVLSLARGELQVSATQFKRMKFQGGIWVNGEPRHSDYRLQEGDRLRLLVPDKGLPLPAPSSNKLDLAYEDEGLLVVNKPAPLPSVRSRQGGETLENLVFSYLGAPEGFVYRPVNRLDKGTSGLMLVAKNAHLQQLMQRRLHTDAFVREYLAITIGGPPREEGSISLNIAHGPGIKRVVDEAGLPARTDYRVLKRGERGCLLALRLHTGRTHQIRVHLAALGCPVWGDFLYGQEDAALPGRFALHAAALNFQHPLTGQGISLSAPLPPALHALAKGL